MTGAAPSLGPCPHCGEPHAEDILVCPKETKVLPLEGRILDSKFRFTRLLGAGGMGAVWRAQNVRVHKAVAIKLMHPEFAGNPGILDRFRNEATAAGQIGSQHICDIYDFGASVLGPYIVLEMLNGNSFGELIQKYGRVEPGLAAIVMRQALEGLEAAHRVGIIHRDLKPENIFLHEPTPGRLLVKLMDFGISKFSQNASNDGKTGVGVLMGTPEYMSPEQAEGAAGVDQRTDIWAMGAILYKALTGVEAFGGATMAATLVALSTKEPKPIESYSPNTPPELIAVVRRCLAKDPAGRYQSARELADALAPFEHLAATGASLPAPQATVSGAFATTAPNATMSAGPPPPQPSTFVTGSHPGMIQPPQPQGTHQTFITGQRPPGVMPSGNPATFVGGSFAGHNQADDSWSIGSQAPETRPPTLSERPAGGSKIPLLIVLVLILATIGGVIYFMGAKKPGAGAEDPAAIARVDPPATTPDPTAGAATAGATAPDTRTDTPVATTTPPDPTAGATAGATPDPTAGATAGATPDPTAGAAEDDDDKPSNTKLPPPKPDLNLVLERSGFFTPKTAAPIVQSLEDAVAHCAGLKKSRFAKLSQWKLATAGQVILFKGIPGLALTFWVSDKASAGRAKRVVLVTGSTNEGDPKTFERTRPFCVAKR